MVSASDSYSAIPGSNTDPGKIICRVRDLVSVDMLSQDDVCSHKPGEGWPPHSALGYRMAAACALYTARYTSVASPL